MKIAILGWGSLLWENSPDFDSWHGPWEYDGPILSIEFSRISKSRRGALTLVIDEDQGIPTQVAWSLSRRSTPDDAIRDLRVREGTSVKNIGQFEIPNRGANSGELGKQDSLIAWANAKKIDSVVWTALESNFEKERKEPFSVAAATAYLQSLDPQGKVKAAEYVWRAPAFVTTRLRSELQREPWFAGN